MSGIGSSSTLHIGRMNFTQNNNNNTNILRKLFLTIFLNNLTKINNKHNNLDTTSLTEYLGIGSFINATYWWDEFYPIIIIIIISVSCF